MEQGQGTGRDTRVMLPVFACVYMIAAELFLPWFSVPVLKYDGFTKTYSLWKIKDCLENIIACTSGGGRWQMEAFTGEETAEILKYAAFMKRAAVLMAVLLAAGAVFAYWKRKKA